ncbi:MAG: nuclear transport factor 2 family protein [Bradymonadales bacterium]|nr:MAG: nuclear transport factor 2 family protein [Bradymonadales bacterium]
MSPQDFFRNFRADRLDLVEAFYDPKIHFVDPLGEHHGVEAMKSYYSRLYENLKEIEFEFQDEWTKDFESLLFWRMRVIHPRLNRGKEVSLEGLSHFRFSRESKLCLYHRDYFDAGAFLYEQLPILGGIIRKLKQVARGQ